MTVNHSKIILKVQTVLSGVCGLSRRWEGLWGFGLHRAALDRASLILTHPPSREVERVSLLWEPPLGL